ncbi:PH domain-containing protein [Agromyces cerinus]|uniref:Putative membrane protein n=1 Tax=Agromyces cerinus subsp. cerinus TaxID=232089 RepID=A0A1N6F8I6_9MICO|nr:PH domain-containing protein [Agromyces cerinus]SIN91591.1 putative membrane protein [Agromyces cerinus subsp. cerinus]
MSGVARPQGVVNLADGEWHRLHPASPLLRGGLVFIAVLGFIIANLRERVIEIFLAIFAPESSAPIDAEYGEWQQDWANDPVGGIVMNGLVGWALLALAAIIITVVIGFWLSWRMHTFRVTHEAVEVRSGILFRSHRSARLDRIQGINVNRPLFARLFGTAKLEISVAGQSANVQLAYLGSTLADALRADVLRLASGARAERAHGAAVPAAADGRTDASALVSPGLVAEPGAVQEPAAEAAGADGATGQRTPVSARAGALVTQRVDEFLAPELDPDLAPPESVVHLPIGRVIGSTVLGGSTIWAIILVAIIVVGVTSGQMWVLFSFVPAAIGLVSYMWSRITKSLRYSIAGTPDGVRIGHGLLSTGNQTIPPGRVHAVEATQWVFWRPFGWWSVRINVAGQSVSASGDAAQRTIVLPVGTAADVHRVLALLLPDAAAEVETLVDAGLVGRGDAGGFSVTPKRAAWLRPFSWKRIGLAETAGVAVIRRGALIRSLSLVPLARMQSVARSVGPIERALDLATLRLHTVTGPVSAVLPVADRAVATALFERLAHEAIERAASDTSHHWGAAAAPDAAAETAPGAPAEAAPGAPAEAVPGATASRAEPPAGASAAPADETEPRHVV